MPFSLHFKCSRSWAGALLFLLSGACSVCSQIEIKPTGALQGVFPGQARSIFVTVRNNGAETNEVRFNHRLYQVGSTLAAPFGGVRAGKKVLVLPGQTIIENVPVDFPNVRAQTRFLIEWVNSEGQRTGQQSVLVFPTNLLGSLMPLTGNAPPALLDRDGMLKRMMRESKIEFMDLGNVNPASLKYSGPLAILFPGEPAEVEAELALKLAKSGAGVVWVVRGQDFGLELEPSVYSVKTGGGTIVVVREGVLAELASNPIAQLNLIRAARMAVNPEPDFLALPSGKP